MVVTDMATTLAFYRALGLEIPAESDSAPHAEAVLPSGMRLMFDTEDVARSLHGDVPPAGPGRAGLAFRAADPAAVNEAYASMTAAGYAGALEPFDAPWGQRYASLTDPDGFGVDLYAAL
ncbi:glyoxalase [Nakamurella sp. YIM 132087]|uniref:Glyoxalase n=1 Tax=Nakamurella alba TaxID=2665158 RepID=A0A7K1FQU5_9ACTN|nr:glyoxalase [Nakamurella alba]